MPSLSFQNSSQETMRKYTGNVHQCNISSNSEFNTAYCLNMTTIDKESIINRESLQLAEDIVCMSLALFGIIGSTLSVVVLQRHRPKTSNTLLLQVLAVSDAFLLLSSLSTNVYKIKIHVTQESKFKLRYFLYGAVLLYDVAQLTSNWILVQLALDRYIAICKPFAAVTWCTISRSWKGVVVIVLGSLILTTPRAIDLLVFNKHTGHNNVYIIVNIILRYYVQIVILFILNIRLIFAIKQAELKHTNLTGTKQSPNRSVTLNLVVVLIVFLVCGTCRGVFYILHNSFPRVFSANTMAIFNTSSKILMTLNSSINFLVYCMFYKRFRLTLHRLCCGCERHDQQSSRWASTTNADSQVFN